MEAKAVAAKAAGLGNGRIKKCGEKESSVGQLQLPGAPGFVLSPLLLRCHCRRGRFWPADRKGSPEQRDSTRALTGQKRRKAAHTAVYESWDLLQPHTQGSDRRQQTNELWTSISQRDLHSKHALHFLPLGLLARRLFLASQSRDNQTSSHSLHTPALTSNPAFPSS